MHTTINRLKLYKKTPVNGLCIFAGLVDQKKFVMELEPILPLKFGFYHCDRHFKMQQLKDQLQDALSSMNSGNQKVTGFVIMNGDGSLCAKVTGSSKDIISKIHVDLMKNHKKGGQSQKRFERNAKINRNEYVKLVAEQVNKAFIGSADVPNVATLVIAGFADLKNVLQDCKLLDYRIAKMPTTIVDIAYGFEQGLEQAIKVTAPSLQGMRFMKEAALLNKMMEDLAKNAKKVAYGVKETMAAAALGVIDTLLVYEDLNWLRVTVTDMTSKDVTMEFLTPEQLAKKLATATDDNKQYEPELLMEWLVDNYNMFGCNLEILSSSTPESKQFIRGFGGMSALLRYEMDVDSMIAADEQAFDADAADDLSEYI